MGCSEHERGLGRGVDARLPRVGRLDDDDDEIEMV